MARRVLMAEVSGGRVRGRLRTGWMDGVKVPLGNRGMMRKRSERVDEFDAAIFAWPCVLSDCALVVIITCRGVGCRYMILLR